MYAGGVALCTDIFATLLISLTPAIPSGSGKASQDFRLDYSPHEMYIEVVLP